MEIKLSDEQLQSAIQEALVLAIPEESRNKMIVDALRWLTEAPKDSYNRVSPSPLQQAFRDALRWAAVEMVRNELSNPDSETSKALHALVDDSMAKLTRSENYNVIVDKFAAALSNALGY